jgi:hypothetical protein
MMEKCPRAWALKYGFKRKFSGNFNRHLINISDWSSPWRLMQRALRGVIIERLDLHAKGKDWPENDLAARIRHRIIGSLERQKTTVKLVELRLGNISKLRVKIENEELNRLIEIACYRFHSAMKSEPIASILRGDIVEWFSCSRLEKTKLDRWDLHVAPDIVWRQGRNWHLLKLTVQGAAIPVKHRRLEINAMVLWGLSRPGMPVMTNRFVVETLTWNRGEWRHWAEHAHDKLVDDATKLIKADMQAMTELYHKMGDACDLSQLPLADQKRTCRNCGHIDTCPGGEDLQRGRLEQSALEMAKASSN